MRFKDYLIQEDSNTFSWEGFSLDDFLIWIKSLKITRKPKAVDKTDHALLKSIKDKASELEELSKNRFASEDVKMKTFEITGHLKYLRISKTEIEEIYSNDAKTEIKTKYAKYIKTDSSSQKKFEENIKSLDEFFSSLKGFHKDVLKNIVIKFVDTKLQKTAGKFIKTQDVMQINTKKAGNTKEEYGSVRYIVLHELGHRYLQLYPQKWDYSDSKWDTTKYSRVDTFLKTEEKFAELFAISHWPSKYNEYKDTIDKFKKMF